MENKDLNVLDEHLKKQVDILNKKIDETIDYISWSKEDKNLKQNSLEYKNLKFLLETEENIRKLYAYVKYIKTKQRLVEKDIVYANVKTVLKKFKNEK